MAWLALDTSETPLKYRKEIISAGDFVKQLPNGKSLPFRITPEFLRAKLTDFQKFREVGRAVPLYLSHIETPENRRGDIIGLEVAKNAKGEDSLFATVEFKDAEAAKVGIANDVSAFFPEKDFDGKGNSYSWPLRHVAITDKPVIPGLDKFYPVLAASNYEGYTMLEKLLEALGVSAEAGDQEAQLTLALSNLAAMKAELEKLKKPPEEKKPDAKPEEKPGEVALSFDKYPANFRSQLIDARKAEIKALALSGEIPTAAVEELQNQYCNEAAFSAELALSESSASPYASALSLLKKVGPSVQRTGGGNNGSPLPHGSNEGKGMGAVMKEYAESRAK